MRQLMFAPGRRLGWHEVEPPALSTGWDAIVRPAVVAVCDADRAIVSGKIPQPSAYRFGHEFVADIVEVGDDVKARTAGERVVVPFKISCGSCERCENGYTAACSTVPLRSAYGFVTEMSGDWGGAMTDLIRVPYTDHMLVPVPDDVRAVDAASAGDNLVDAYRCVAPGLTTQPGSSVLIMAGGGGAPSISLYAAPIAVALGSERVDYVDGDPVRLSIAEKLGANPIEAHTPPADMGDYPTTADTSAHPSGRWLEATIRASAPVWCLHQRRRLLQEPRNACGRDVRPGHPLTIGWVNSRPNIPKVLDLLADRAINVEPIHTVAPWDSATETIPAGHTKRILSRGGLST
jgi:threonine dehydrogenase-like Zn-dependent dehydrogenase